MPRDKGNRTCFNFHNSPTQNVIFVIYCVPVSIYVGTLYRIRIRDTFKHSQLRKIVVSTDV